MTMPTDIGIVDLGIGFPYTSVEQKMHAYDFFRANLKDAQSQQEMEFPVQYIFKGVPDVVDEDTDVVEWVLEKMDAFNIAHRARRSLTERTRSAAAVPGPLRASGCRSTPTTSWAHSARWTRRRPSTTS